MTGGAMVGPVCARFGENLGRCCHWVSAGPGIAGQREAARQSRCQPLKKGRLCPSAESIGTRLQEKEASGAGQNDQQYCCSQKPNQTPHDLFFVLTRLLKRG